MEEGIDNIQNLVNNDLVDLMLQLRVPLPRLLDWIDQGILYMHLTNLGFEGHGPAVDNQAGSSTQTSHTHDALIKLRYYGIRTASDLETAYYSAKERDKNIVKEAVRPGFGQPVEVPQPDDKQAEMAMDEPENESTPANRLQEIQPPSSARLTEAERFLSLLDAPDAKVQRLRVVMDTLADDDWLPYIQRWRQPSRYSRDLLIKADVFVIDEQQKFGMKIADESSVESNTQADKGSTP
jgi:hypothetical protein